MNSRLIDTLQDKIFDEYYKHNVRDYILFNKTNLARLDCLLIIKGERPRWTVPGERDPDYETDEGMDSDMEAGWD